jgi:hypothetical protein
MPKFNFFVCGNPTNKTITGTAYTWELLIANHLDQSLWSTNQKFWAAIRSNWLLSVAPFTSHGKRHKFGPEKWISWAKLAHFDFFAINFTVWSHILSTSGDALTAVLGYRYWTANLSLVNWIVQGTGTVVFADLWLLSGKVHICSIGHQIES